MKFYIASRLDNHAQVRHLAELLMRCGWEWTFDWTAHVEVGAVDCDVLRSIGQRECEGVARADIVVVLSPQGRGVHVELGMAIALGKAVYICHEDDRYFRVDGDSSAFYWVDGVRRFVGGVEELAEHLRVL